MEPIRFLVCDQLTERVTLYDTERMQGTDLDSGEIWSFPAGHTAGLKYREGSVFGDVILIAGLTCQMVSYPSGEILWKTEKGGKNSHSIELLPSGNLIIANSDGNSLRFFTTAALKSGGEISFTDLPLQGAHGVLWDPEYGLLWALGHASLTAYRICGTGREESLAEAVSVPLPTDWPGGHNLSPDLTDKEALWVSTNRGLLRFQKETQTFSPEFSGAEALPSSFLKSLDNDPKGRFLYCASNFGTDRPWKDWWKASWLSDRITVLTKSGTEGFCKTELISEKGAFYKCRLFFERYL